MSDVQKRETRIFGKWDLPCVCGNGRIVATGGEHVDVIAHVPPSTTEEPCAEYDAVGSAEQAVAFVERCMNAVAAKSAEPPGGGLPPS